MANSITQFAAIASRFSGKLFGEMSNRNTGKNLFISPLNIFITLLILYEGAEAGTRSELSSALELNGLNIEELCAAYVALKSRYSTPDSAHSLEDVAQAAKFVQLTTDVFDEKGYYIDDDVVTLTRLFGIDYREHKAQALEILKNAKQFRLHLLSALWLKQDSQLNPDFIEMCRSIFDVQIIQQAKFDSESAGDINRWVQDATVGHIRELLMSLESDAVMVIVSVVYFRAYWQKQFSKSATQMGDFRCLDGALKICPMMRITDWFQHYRTATFEVVSLPYADPSGKRPLCMDIFLPSQHILLPQFQTIFQNLCLHGWNELLHLEYGTVELPRFRIEAQVELIDTLIALGVNSAFDSKSANFSRIRGLERYRLFVTQFLQQGLITVDEDGTEATTATLMVMAEDWGEGDSVKPFRMVINRPFLFTIRDNNTNALLFM